jgi:nitrate/nitrite transport system permease protein
MVAAVFHSSFQALAISAPSATKYGAAHADFTLVSAGNASESVVLAVPAAQTTRKPAYDWRALWLTVVPPILGLALLVGIWAMVSVTSSNNFPSPWATAQQAVQVFSDPFYRLEHLEFTQARGAGLWTGCVGGHSAGLCDWALYVSQPHV